MPIDPKDALRYWEAPDAPLARVACPWDPGATILLRELLAAAREDERAKVMRAPEVPQ